MKEIAQLNSWHLHPFPSSAPSNLLPQISKHLKDSLSAVSTVIPTEKLQHRKAEKLLQHCPTTCWERRRQDWFSTIYPSRHAALPQGTSYQQVSRGGDAAPPLHPGQDMPTVTRGGK